MKALKPSKFNQPIAACLTALALLIPHFAASPAGAATYFWDTDGATAGFGNNIGTWGIDAFWSTNANGGVSTVFTDTTTTNDLVNFAGTGNLALGASAASVAVSGTVSANRITFGVAQPAGLPVVLSGGTIALGGGAPQIAPNSTNATINSAIALNTNAQINGPNGGAGGTVMTLNLNGAISGGFNVTFFGPSGLNNYSTIFLGAPSTYSGNTLLNCAGTGANLWLKLGVDDALPTATVLTLDGGNAGGTAAGRYVRLDLNGFNQTLAGLTTVSRGARRDQCIVNSASASAATLTVNNSADQTYSGQLGTGGNGFTSGPNFGLTKNNGGRLTLNPANTNGSGAIINIQYTGPTAINGGILEIGTRGRLGNGNYAGDISIASGAALLINSINDATLSGSLSGSGSLTNAGAGTVNINGSDALANTIAGNGGTIAINGGFVNMLTVNDGGKVSLPGAGVGTVTNLTFDNTGTMTFNVVNGGTLTVTAADGVTNQGAAGSITINITGTAPVDGTYTLIAYSGNLQGSGFSAYQLGATPLGKSYTLVDSGSAVQLVVSTPFFWTGAQSSEWSINPIGGLQNWTYLSSPADYVNGSGVVFDDTLTGSSTVDVSVADVTPTTVAFNNANTNYTLQGSRAITGAASLNKSGAAPLTVLNDNSYSGPTIVSAGTLQVGNGGTSGTLGSGTITDNGALQFNRSDAITLANPINGTGSLAQNGSGTLTLAGANIYGGATAINSGTLAVSGGAAIGDSSAVTLADVVGVTLKLNNNETIGSLAGGGGTGGTVDLQANTLTVAGSANTTFAGTISGSGGTLTKSGTGTLTLGGRNTYSGATIVNAGNLAITDNDALGTTDGATTINGGNGTGAWTLNLSSATSDLMIAEPLNFFGNPAGRAQLAKTSAQVHTLSGNIDVTSETNLVQFSINAFSAATPGGLTISGDIIGAFTGPANLLLRGGTSSGVSASNSITGNITLTGGGVVKTDASTWTIGAPGKAYSAPAIASAVGTLKMGTINYLTGAPVLTLGNSTGGSSGSFDLNGFDQTVGGIIYNGAPATTGTRTITSSAGPAVLTVSNATDYTATGSGVNSVVLTGALGLTKQGTGKLTLSGTNTYTGATTVSAGTLLVNGLTGSGAVTVNASGTLGGNGSIGGQVTVNAGGVLSPGTGTNADRFSVAGFLQFQPGATLAINLNGTNAGAYDQLLCDSDYLLGGATLAVTLGYAPAPGDQYAIIDGGPLAFPDGQFAGLPDGATFAVGGYLFVIQYGAVDGNAVLLTCVGPATAISSAGPLSGASFPLTFSGLDGQTYQVLTSTNVALPLPSWSVLTSGTFGAGPITYTDTTATNLQQFYIIKSP